jgi:hypothetical protein
LALALDLLKKYGALVRVNRAAIRDTMTLPKSFFRGAGTRGPCN